MNISKTIKDKDFVEQLLPQKFPFVMVDSLYSYTEVSVDTGFTISADNIFFSNGQFRESGLIEHMAQSVALHTGYQFFLRNEPAPTGYIGSINSLHISDLPKLGDEIRSRVDILQEFGGITLVDVYTLLNGTEIARGQMKTVLAK
jgi:predicted hotdog family 3-hydroxylacyl-ACP dehydratase